MFRVLGHRLDTTFVARTLLRPHGASVMIATTRRAFLSTGGEKRVIQALYAGHGDRYEEYRGQLVKAFDSVGLNVCISDDFESVAPSTYDYIICSPTGPIKDFGPFSNVKAVFNLWAGLEGMIDNPTLPKDVPLTRMVDPGLRDGMVEYVVGHVMRYHLTIDEMWESKRKGIWTQSASQETMMPLAPERCVGILGMGELGTSCANALEQGFHFQVMGWTRTEKADPRIHHGPEGLQHVLSHSDILVMLLPNTPETVDIMNEDTLAHCKPGIKIINAGRGSLIDDDALLKALDSGLVGGATLDVFKKEPLPLEHGYWSHPNVLITPHIAAKTRSVTAAHVIADNIRRAESGEPLLYVVNRKAGY